MPWRSALSVDRPASRGPRTDGLGSPALAVRAAALSIWPLLSGGLVLLTAIALLLRNMLALTDGTVAYTLDDTYIHLATARTWLEHGVWGATASASASVSSSPIWVVLLALAGWTGVPLNLAPVLLATIAGVVAVCAVDAIWREQHVGTVVRATALPAVVLATPLPGLAVMGMEHALHAALCLVFWLELQRPERPARAMRLLTVAAMWPLVRFESLLLIGTLVLAYRRTLGSLALRVILVAVVSVALFSAASLMLDWMWLPNPVLLKNAAAHGLWSSAFLTGSKAVQQLSNTPEMLALTIALPAVALLPGTPGSSRRLALALVGTVLGHAQLASFGWQSRYEAYLVALCATAVVSMVAPLSSVRGLRRRGGLDIALVATLVGVTMLPLVARARRSLLGVPVSSRNIYDQQLQSARFVRDFLTVEGPVVVNDIGAVAFFSQRAVIDHLGLATTEIARMRLAGTYTTAVLADLAASRHAQAAIVYPELFAGEGGVPPSWILVGIWTIADNIACGEPSVSVYATSPSSLEPLRAAFGAFAATLPPRTLVQRPPVDTR